MLKYFCNATLLAYNPHLYTLMGERMSITSKSVESMELLSLLEKAEECSVRRRLDGVGSVHRELEDGAGSVHRELEEGAGSVH